MPATSTDSKPSPPKATRSKAEELALRRSQLERRQKRLAAAKTANTTPPPEGAASLGVGMPPGSAVSSSASPSSRPPPSPSLNDVSYGKAPPYSSYMVEAGIPPIPAVLEARERAVRMAKAELELERKARAEAEQRAADMCQMALDLELEAKAQAEERLRAEEAATKKKAQGTTRRALRVEAAVTIQKIWRGWWLRKCFEEGMAELRHPIEKVQSMWRAAKIRKTVKLAVLQNREKLAHHVCIEKSLAETEKILPSTVLRIVEFDAEPGPLGLKFQDNGEGVTIPDAFDAESKAGVLGVMAGMTLIAFQSASVVGQSHEQVTNLLKSTPRPWKFGFQMPDDHQHAGRTLRSMVDALRMELGIDASLSIVEALDKAEDQTGASGAFETLHHRCCAVCHHLGIDTENEPIKPLSLTGCLKAEYNGDYVHVGEANGRPHWRSTTGYHLWWGTNSMWLLRRKFEAANANATAFHDPGSDGAADTAGVEKRGSMSVIAPLGQTDWNWFDPQTKDWVSNIVVIEEGDAATVAAAPPQAQAGGGAAAGDGTPKAKRQLDLTAESPQPGSPAGGAAGPDDIELEEVVEELPSTMSLPAGAEMQMRLFRRAKWEQCVKDANDFVRQVRGCLMDVKAHVTTDNACVIMVLYDPEGEQRDNARVVIKTSSTKSLTHADTLKALNNKKSLGLIATSISPKNGGTSADRKSLQQIVCTGAPGRQPYSGVIKCDVVESKIWRDVVDKCQARCSEITQGGGVIVEVDIVGADTAGPVASKKGGVKWGKEPLACNIFYSEEGGSPDRKVHVGFSQVNVDDMEKNLLQLARLCNDVRRRFICSSFACNTINDGRNPKAVCSLLVVSHETLEVPADTPKSEKMLGKSQCREMVRITLEIEQVDSSKVTDKWIDDLFDRYDTNKSGQIDDSEWERLAAGLKDEVAKIGKK